MAQEAYQIQIEGWTKTGFRYVVQKTVKDDAAAKEAMDIPNRLGLLPERLEMPDVHKYGKISHVALTHTKEGVPHVAFYHENVKLESRWTHKYLDSAEERQAFEAWSGLSLAQLPAQSGNTHPVRGKGDYERAMVALPAPMALIRLTVYEKVIEKDKASWEPEHDVQKYIGTAKKQEIHWSKDAAQTKLADDWIIKAKEAKHDIYVEALAAIDSRDSFPTRTAYLEALAAIAAKKEAEAKREEVPFS